MLITLAYSVIVFFQMSINHYLSHHNHSLPFLQGVRDCVGVAIDWISDILYYVVDSDTPVIRACLLTPPTVCTTVISGDMDKPRAVAVDPHAG